MRLLHALRGEIKSFIVDDDIPPYAILSHSWGEEEITFQDWQDMPNPQLRQRKGHLKIRYCCEQALREGLEWVWVDTCCIDKTSSAELSESINSMFRWYTNSKICYAYLSDVSFTNDQTMFDSEFCKSRWFTRGWTLQELIAPAAVTFYSTEWHLLGNRSSLSGLIHSTTLIEPKYLNGTNLHLAGAAKKMSWAAHRQTSRIEDTAYCLLGLFDINMPLLYGEGEKAFRRLQEEIIKTNPEDHSLFAWGSIVPKPSIEITDPAQLSGTTDIPWAGPGNLLGLFARSPRDFAGSGRFVPNTRRSTVFHRTSFNRSATSLPVPVNGGIRIHLPVLSGGFHSVFHWHHPKMSQVRRGIIAVLLCCDEEHPEWVVQIPLQRWGFMNYGRTEDLIFDDRITLRHESLLFQSSRVLYVAPKKRTQLQCGDIVLRRHLFERKYQASSVGAGNSYREFDDEGVLEVNGMIHGKFISISHETPVEVDEHLGFALCLSRVSPNEGRWGPFVVGLVPVILDSKGERDDISHAGIEWVDVYRSLDVVFPPYSHVMLAPCDRWELNVAPFPFIRVTVERMEFEGPLGEDIFIDAVDIVISERPGDTAYYEAM